MNPTPLEQISLRCNYSVNQLKKLIREHKIPHVAKCDYGKKLYDRDLICELAEKCRKYKKRVMKRKI